MANEKRNERLGESDLVVSLSENIINTGFNKLYQAGKIDNQIYAVYSENHTAQTVTTYNTKEKYDEWQADLQNYRTGKMLAADFINKWHTSYGWRAIIHSPTVSIKTLENMIFQLNISTGQLINLADKDDPWIVDLKDSTYAFSVPVKKIVYDLPHPNATENTTNATEDTKSALSQYVKPLAPDSYSIEQLLLNFTDANIVSYDPDYSTLPKAVKESPLLAGLVSKYYKDIGKKDAHNGHVIGYQVSVPKSSSDAIFQPNAIINNNSLAEENSLKEKLHESSFNYIAMTSCKPFSGQNTGVLPQSLLAPGDKNGVMILGASTLIDFLKTQIDEMLSKNCYTPFVNVSYHSKNLSCTYEWRLDHTNEQPFCQRNDTASFGQPVLSYSYSKSAFDKASMSSGDMRLTCALDASLSFSESSLIFKKHLALDVKITHLSDSSRGRVYDTTYTDTYNLKLENNQLTWDYQPQSDLGNTHRPGTSGFLSFFNSLNDLGGDIDRWGKEFGPQQFQSTHFSLHGSPILPGSGAFKFLNPHFDYQNNLLVELFHKE